MTDLLFPLSESTLILGPSDAGKTHLTARALEEWIEREGTDGVVVLDFAPVIERDDGLLGGRLDRFVSVPNDVWTGVLEAHAPRTEGDSTDEAVSLARTNAERATRLVDAAPADPTAVFVNDATIARQHTDEAPHAIAEYCGRADVSVLNALEGVRLGGDDRVSSVETKTREYLRRWATRTLSLP